MCVCVFTPRAPVQTLKQLFLLCGMKIGKIVLLIPWQLFDLVQCKPLVKEFNNFVDSKKSKNCTKLHLQLAFEEVVCTEEFANTGLFCKTIDRSGNRNSCANIGRNFKSCNLTEEQFVSKETACTSLGPVGPKMTMKPDGVLMSGMSYKFHEGASETAAHHQPVAGQRPQA